MLPATSAVDLDTDKAIQEIIRGPDFADVTMLTIAYVFSHLCRFLAKLLLRHRLNTIMDSDRILVLDAGGVIEFEHPEALLAKKESKFYSLAAESGLA